MRVLENELELTSVRLFVRRLITEVMSKMLVMNTKMSLQFNQQIGFCCRFTSLTMTAGPNLLLICDATSYRQIAISVAQLLNF
jgi:hypothetical protein